MTKLTYWDLINNRNKYCIEELEANLQHLEIKHILQTQTLTAEFCVKYVLNEDYASCQEDLYLIDIGYVLYHQKHLTREMLEEKIKELTKATIRCIPLGVKKEKGTCILTGAVSEHRVIFARAY